MAPKLEKKGFWKINLNQWIHVYLAILVALEEENMNLDTRTYRWQNEPWLSEH